MSIPFSSTNFTVSLLLGFLLLFLQAVNANTSVFVINSIHDDYSASASYCIQPPTDLCNLRSAWLACSAVQSACEIILPNASNLYINATYGSLRLQESMNVTIKGGGTIITSGYASMQFINYTTAVTSFSTSAPPALQIVNMTISGFGKPSTDNGGALNLLGDLTLSIDQVNFINNTALSGGAIYISNNSLPATIVSSSFHNCTATLSGGAIHADQLVRLLRVETCHFESCIAGNQGSAVAVINSNSNVEVAGCIFKNCEAIDGTLYLGSNNNNANIRNCAFSHNIVKNRGGAIFVDGYDGGNLNVSIHNTHIEDCTAKYGGGVYFNANNHHSTITSSIFARCTATQAYGAIAFIGFSSYNSMVDVIIADCHAFNIGGIALSGGIDHFLIRDTTIASCSSRDTRNVGGGGAGWFSDSSNLTMLNTRIHNCSSAGLGGGILTNSITQLTMDGVHFELCSSVLGGGCLNLQSSKGVAIQNSSFINCTSVTDSGGAICAESIAQMSILNVSVVGSHAEAYGGGLYSYANNDIGIYNCQFTAGDSNSGGGVYFATNNNNIRVLNTIFEGNAASYAGGGMYVGENNANMLLGGVNVKSNKASDYGGGIYYYAALPNLVITDLDSALASQMLQYMIIPDDTIAYGDTEDYWFFEKVHNAQASGYILNFASSPSLPEWYILTISSGSTILTYTLGAPLPGVGAPSLEIMNSTFEVRLSGDSCLSCDGSQGFKLFVTPITEHAAAPSIIDNNSAGTHGGGVYINGGLSFSLVMSTQFSMNTAAVDGGGLYMFSNNNNVMLHTVLLTNNTASSSGGGIYLFGNIELLVISNASFLQNTAANGGGLFINFNVGGNISNSLFSYNTAVVGGGVVLQTTQIALSFFKVEFVCNMAQSGGGVAINTNNGAKVYQYSLNPITFLNCSFQLNTAINGGAVYTDTGNVITFHYSRFSNNTASGTPTSSGGGIGMNSLNQITLAANVFEDNFAAYSGGGIASRDQNTIYMEGGILDSNKASIGGGLFIQDQTSLTFVNTTLFIANVASGAGGAIASVNTRIWSVATTAFVKAVNNKASRGSALFFKSLVVGSSSIDRFLFYTNVASVGGTVYWLYDSSMRHEPAGLRSASNVWYNNVAPYGNVSATQGVQLVGPDQYTVQYYLTAMTPPLVYNLKDFYDHYIPLTGSTSVVPYVNTIASHDCSTSNPSIAGSDTLGVIFRDGAAVFDSLQAYCYPGGTFTLNLSAHLGDQINIFATPQSASYYITKQTQIGFRNCDIGEKILSAACVSCPVGSYSLVNYVTVDTQCILCGSIQGVQSCQTSIITLKSGFWRRYPSSNAVQTCPQELNGCMGGNSTGDMLCKTGFTGPLCATCEEGYFVERSDCVSCGGSQALPSSTIVFIVVLSVLIVVLSGYIYRRYYQLKGLTKERTVKSPDSNTSARSEEFSRAQFNLLDKSLLWFAAHYKTVITKLKITVVTYQIISAVPGVFSVTFPSAFTSFLHSITFVNLNFVSLLSLQCSTKYTFIDELIVSTLLPIGIALVMFVAFVVQIVYVAKRLEQNPTRGVREARDRYDAIKNQYLNYLFYLTYLILPSISTRIFQTFLCTNIDPEDEYPLDDNLYLTADMNISCTSPYYYRGKAYAIFMIFVYPIGIPGLYMYLLYQNRMELRNRTIVVKDNETVELLVESSNNLEECHDCEAVTVTPNPICTKLESEDASVSEDISSLPGETVAARDKEETTLKLSASAQRLAFLWVSFKPQYWYWEIIETTRRLMLTAVLSITGSGTSQQAVLALLLAIFYIKLYSYFAPYEQRASDITAEIGQYQVLFTFLGALISMDSLLNAKYNSTVDALLILFNLGVLFAFWYYELTDLCWELTEQRKKKYCKDTAKLGKEDTCDTEIEMVHQTKKP